MDMVSFKKCYKDFINQYGTRRGVIRTFWHKFKNFFGAYNKYKKIDWSQVDRLVFVCKGNICRSAYAEEIARSLHIKTISFGINAILDEPANAGAIKVAACRGIDLAQHKTTPLASVVLEATDLVVAMEPWQAEALHTKLQRKYPVTLLGLWLCPLRPHIQDPYGRNEIYFNNCFEYIEKSVYEITKKIKEA